MPPFQPSQRQEIVRAFVVRRDACRELLAAVQDQEAVARTDDHDLLLVKCARTNEILAQMGTLLPILDPIKKHWEVLRPQFTAEEQSAILKADQEAHNLFETIMPLFPKTQGLVAQHKQQVEREMKRVHVGRQLNNAYRTPQQPPPPRFHNKDH